MTRTASLLLGLLLIGVLVGCSEKPPATLVAIPTPEAPFPRPVSVSRDSVFSFTRQSYQRVGALHSAVLCGDFSALIEAQHRAIQLQLDLLDQGYGQRRTGCSMFQDRTLDGRLLMGRNFDHKDTEVLVAWCYPDSGYASVGLVPLNQWGFTPAKPFAGQDPGQRRILIRAPQAVIEGINEKGVAVTLASVETQAVTPRPDREPRFLIHLVRDILDHAGNLDQAVALAERYNVFDNGRDQINHHIFIADPEAGSALLEWHDGTMQVLRSGNGPQVVTNNPAWDRSPEELGRSCRRFRTLWSTVADQKALAGWEAGMAALESAVQHNHRYEINGEPWVVSTQWSAVFDLEMRGMYLCVGGDYGTVYRLQSPRWMGD